MKNLHFEGFLLKALGQRAQREWDGDMGAAHRARELSIGSSRTVREHGGHAEQLRYGFLSQFLFCRFSEVATAEILTKKELVKITVMNGDNGFVVLRAPSHGVLGTLEHHGQCCHGPYRRDSASSSSARFPRMQIFGRRR